MAAGDQLRKAAQQTKLQAKQNRDKAQDYKKQSDEFIQMANKLENEVPILEQQARDADAAEQRANAIRNSN